MALGTAIIIVNETFNKDKGHKDRRHKDRKGATQDRDNMEAMFTELKYKVEVHFNKTATEIQTEFQKASSIQSDIIVFVISTHGEESHLANINSHGTKVYDQMIVGSDGQTVSVNNLIRLLDNDALRGKTKLCFIQACRSNENMEKADKVDLGVTVEVSEGMQIHEAKIDDTVDDVKADAEDDIDTGEGDTGVMPKLPEAEIEQEKYLDDSESETAPDECESQIHIAPVECPRDCLVMYGSPPHKFALRGVGKGSWMLHYMFEERHSLQQNDGNVLKYFTTVLRKMADHDKATYGKPGQKEKVKLCGTIYHRLTREVFMKKM